MDASRFLFCSLDAALVADLAWQVAREGHDVHLVRHRLPPETHERLRSEFFLVD